MTYYVSSVTLNFKLKPHLHQIHVTGYKYPGRATCIRATCIRCKHGISHSYPKSVKFLRISFRKRIFLSARTPQVQSRYIIVA